MTVDILAFVRMLADAGVDFIIVGGVAARANVSERLERSERSERLE